MMRYCKKCGTQLTDGAFFCPKCGNPVAQPGQAAPNVGYSQSGQAAPNAFYGNSMPQKGNKKAIGIIAGIVGLIVVAVVLISVFLTGCYLGHDWQEADCTIPMTCAKCGKTEGEALGHEWQDATCTEAKNCSVCGETEGEALGHTWTDATCTVSKTCSVCGETEGEALGHTWLEATCTVSKTCSVCGETEGEALGHIWTEGTCTIPQMCKRCKRKGEALGHDLNGVDVCNRCGEYMGAGIAFTFEDGVLTVFGKGELTVETWKAALEKYGGDVSYIYDCNTMVITGNITGISRDVFDKYEYYVYGPSHDSLEKLVIEDSVTGDIGYDAFGERYNLDDVYIGNGIRSISCGAFTGVWVNGITSFSISSNCILELARNPIGEMTDIFGYTAEAGRQERLVTRRR